MKKSLVLIGLFGTHADALELEVKEGLSIQAFPYPIRDIGVAK